MKTKTDIQLELLQEIDEVCSKNHLNYILFEIDGLNPFHKTKEEPGLISVAMTQGDIERFSKIMKIILVKIVMLKASLIIQDILQYMSAMETGIQPTLRFLN